MVTQDELLQALTAQGQKTFEDSELNRMFGRAGKYYDRVVGEQTGLDPENLQTSRDYLGFLSPAAETLAIALEGTGGLLAAGSSFVGDTVGNINQGIYPKNSPMRMTDNDINSLRKTGAALTTEYIPTPIGINQASRINFNNYQPFKEGKFNLNFGDADNLTPNNFDNMPPGGFDNLTNAVVKQNQIDAIGPQIDNAPIQLGNTAVDTLDTKLLADNTPTNPLKIDNPGGDWLQGKLEYAQEQRANARPNTYSSTLGTSEGVTGYYGKVLQLDPTTLKDIKGAAGEELYRPQKDKINNLRKSIAEKGYEESPILIHVREDGVPFVVEGNHRIIEGVESNRPTIPVEIKYLRGGEEADGILSPTALKNSTNNKPKISDELVNSVTNVNNQIVQKTANEIDLSSLIPSGKNATIEEMMAATQRKFDTVPDTTPPVKGPIQVRHATTADNFDTFSNPEIGFHFADDPMLAANAAIKTGKDPKELKILDVELNMNNPVEITAQGNSFNAPDVLEDMVNRGYINDQQFEDAYARAMIIEDRTIAKDTTYVSASEAKILENELIKEVAETVGIDGFYYHNEFDAGLNPEGTGLDVMPGRSYIALRPEQAVINKPKISDELVDAVTKSSYNPTLTGWNFKDVNANMGLTKSETQRIARGAVGETAVVPIRSINATQSKVNSDFATTESSSGELPRAVRKNGQIYLLDGHHRITKVADEGNQNARINLIDFDRADTSTPLLDFNPEKHAAQKAETNALMAELLDVGSPLNEAKRLPQNIIRTDTPSFRKWFGNSKVVDEGGKPLTVYHGGVSDISEFKKSKLGGTTKANSAKEGFWFTDDPTTAKSYSDYSATDAKVLKIIDDANIAEKKGDWDLYDKKIGEAEDLEATFMNPQNRMSGQNIMPVHLALKNPYEIDAGGEMYMAIEDSITDQIKRAKKLGHDGVVIKNLDDAAGIANRPANHYLVFEPEKIKSIHNRGKYNPKDANILNSIAPITSAGVGGAAIATTLMNEKEKDYRNTPQTY